MAKKGIFEKLGLVEEVPQEPREEDFDSGGIYENFQEEEHVLMDASLEEVNTESLIEDIYAENNLSDRTRSIFKVQDIINSLPSEMTTAVKRQTVLSLLTNFGLTAEEVMEDGTRREAVLNQIKNDIIAESDETIADYETQIESLKEQIATKEKLIAAEKEKKASSSAIINGEVENVSKLIAFIGEEKV